jgi:hypothetical protein
MCAAVNIYPIDPLRGPVVLSITDGDTWASQAWNNLTHRVCTVYVSSDQAVTLFIDHAHSDASLTDAPISSQHAVAANTPASFHEKLDARISRIRVSNASGFEANVTLDVILRPTASEDNASTRLTLAGVDVASGNPLPVVGAVVGDVEVVQPTAADLNATVVQAVASSLNATVTQAGTVTVAATALDTRALTSATDAVTVTGTVLVNPGGLNIPATVFQDDPTELHCTVTQAATVVSEGLEMQVAIVESPNNTAVYPVAACRVYGVYFSHDNGTLLQTLALYDATSGVTSASTPKLSLMLPSGKTHDSFGGTDNYLTFSSGVSVRCVAAISPSSTTAPSANTQAVIIYRLV